VYKVLDANLPPPSPDSEAGPRPTAVHLLPTLIAPEDLAGCIAVVIDALRASVTITQALASGCPCIHPVLSVQDARDKADHLRAQGNNVLLGGERAGVRPEGFDLGNSPSAYTPGAVGGREIVFTTTNGTATLLHARRAGLVLVACMGNVQTIADAIAKDARPVHILCAGTREEVSMEDALVAGALTERLVGAGRTLVADDSARLCVLLHAQATSRPDGVLRVFRDSRGGRNLRRIGLDADIVFCVEHQLHGVAPVYDDASGGITGLGRGPR